MEQQYDKRSFIGFILITLIVTGWVIWMSTSQRNTPTPQNNQSSSAQSNISRPSAAQAEQKVGKALAPLAAGGEQFIRIETDLARISLSSRGASIARWELRNYSSWHDDSYAGVPVQLINKYSREGAISFIGNEGRKVDTRLLNFSFDGQSGNTIRLRGNDSVTITARLQTGPGSQIIKSFTLYGNRYTCRAGITLQNMEQYLPQRSYDMIWQGGLQFQEQNSVDEANSSVAIASINGSLEELDATDYGQPKQNQVSGQIDYLATRTKYFVAAIKPMQNRGDALAFLEGIRIGALNDGMTEKYSMSYRVRYNGGQQTDEFLMYIGPQIYDSLRRYGLEKTINFGTFYGVKWLVAPIGEYIMLPILRFVHSFIPNYGVAILVFSIIMKMLLYPFGISQMKSMQKNKAVQPLLQRLQAKYKDDRMALSQETMKIYQEYGINPTGGCLPMLLQMPILIALWAVLNSSIDIRQAYFFGWITDLSVPDVILNLGFKIPLFHVDRLSGLALLMGITMFVQQKMTITDPNQKSMVYIMPIMFTFMFSGFPAGLNVYYLTFTLLGIGQQIYVTRFSKNQITLEDLKKMPRKEGWLQKRMREAQEMAAAQGRSVPGMPPGGNEGNKRQPIGNKLPNSRKKK
jgi:YidC/Oxa1 family membrane protein insertase